MKMSTVRQDYEGLLQNKTEDELLLWAFEESRRHYKEVELPRLSQTKKDPSTETDAVIFVDSSRGEGSSVQQEKLQEKEAVCFLGLNENGFDLDAGSKWIYPINYPVRDYQFSIVNTALYKNTLVSLDTGLGKTFIAAVVMYNFYRWYPQGLVLFLAPTRPLVAQQIDACYKITGIPRSDTAEMTGSVTPKLREEYWKKCRVFFLTPQSLMSDLSRSTCPVEKVRCIVIDEAHKATGNYAYCQVIQAILPFNEHFRVLALSATPGNDMEAMQMIIKNLIIEHVEVRDETSEDVKPFTNQRLVEAVVVKLGGFHKQVEGRFLHIIQGYMNQIQKWKLLYGNVKQVSKYQLLLARQKFRQCPPPNMTKNVASHLESDFAVCMSLCHGLELISQQGLRSFYQYLRGVLDDSDGSHSLVRGRIAHDNELESLMENLEEQLGVINIKEPDPNTSLRTVITQTQTPRVYTHPKMEKLRDVVVAHFQSFLHKEEETRVMVFCQYRGTVSEICHVLSREKLVKAMSFVGQSSNKSSKGFSQKVQLEIMAKFRRGGYNTLVSTCVGEEGLDIGEVDLIVCYDAHTSPIRLVQRMGRTGRKREGRIVMLLTEGKERQKYMQSLNNKKNMANALLNSKQFLQFTASPRMIPEDIEPACYKMYMTMPKISRNGDLKQMLAARNSRRRVARNVVEDIDILKEEEDIGEDMLPLQENLHALNADELQKAFTAPLPKIDLARDLDFLLNNTGTIHVSRSRAAEDLVELLKFAGKKRCDVPVSQTADMASQMCRTELWPGKKRKKSQEGTSKRRKQANKTADVGKSNQNRLTSLWTAIAESSGSSKKSDISEVGTSNSDYELMPPPLARPVRSTHSKKVLKSKEAVDFSLADNVDTPGAVSTDENRCLSPEIEIVIENSRIFDTDVRGINSDDEEKEMETFKETLDCARLSQQGLVASLTKDWNLIDEVGNNFKNLLLDSSANRCSFCDVLHCNDLLSLSATENPAKCRSALSEIAANLPDINQVEKLLNPLFLKNLHSDLIKDSPKKVLRCDNSSFFTLEDFELPLLEEDVDANDDCSKRISSFNSSIPSAYEKQTAPITHLASVCGEGPSRSIEEEDRFEKFHEISPVACESHVEIRPILKHLHGLSAEEGFVTPKQFKQDLPFSERTAHACNFAIPNGNGLKNCADISRNSVKEFQFDLASEFMKSKTEKFNDRAEENDTGFNLGLTQLLSLSPGLSKAKKQDILVSERYDKSPSSGFNNTFSQRFPTIETDSQESKKLNNVDKFTNIPLNKQRSENRSNEPEKILECSVSNTPKDLSQYTGDITQYVDDALIKWLPLSNDEFQHSFREDQTSTPESCTSEATKASSPEFCSKKNRKFGAKSKRLKLVNEIEPERLFPMAPRASTDPFSLNLPSGKPCNEKKESDLKILLSGSEFEEQMEQLANCVELDSAAPLSPILGSQPSRKKRISPSDLELSDSSPSILSGKFVLPSQRSTSTPRINKRFVKKELFTGLGCVKKDSLKTPTIRSSFSPRDAEHKESSNSDSDSDFEIKAPRKIAAEGPSDKREREDKNLQRNRAGNLFIEDEAEESRDDRRDSSDGENTSGLDDLDNSFVDDEEHSEMLHNSVDIQAQYLQSVRTPLKRHGQFKIKEVKNFRMNVYSQVPPEEELNESYEEDSFCVNTSSELSESETEPDTLDVIEAALRHKKKRKNQTPKSTRKKKRKRIRVISSSSDDETSPKQPEKLSDGDSSSSVILVPSQDKQDISKNNVPLITNSSKQNRFARCKVGAKRTQVCDAGDRGTLAGTWSKPSTSKDSFKIKEAGLPKLRMTTESDDLKNLFVNISSDDEFDYVTNKTKPKSLPEPNPVCNEVIDLCDVEWGDDDFDELKKCGNGQESPELDVVSSRSYLKESKPPENVIDAVDLFGNPSEKDIDEWTRGVVASQEKGQTKRKLKFVSNKTDKKAKLTDYFSHGLKQGDSSEQDNMIPERNVNFGNPSTNSSDFALNCFSVEKAKSSLGAARYSPVCIIENNSEVDKKENAGSKPKNGLISLPSSSSSSKRTVDNKIFPQAKFAGVVQNSLCKSEKLVMLVSSRYVKSFPEIITALKSRHRISVLVLSLKVAQFVISSKVGVLRIPFDEFCRSSNWSSLLDTANQMKSLFQQPYLVVELKALDVSEKALWSLHSVDLSTKVQERGVKVLYSESKAITADILASLYHRENSWDRGIKVPSKEQWKSAVQFLELLPCINIALALELCYKYETLATFMKRCETVSSIQESLAISREAARQLYFLLHDVAI